MQYKLYSCRIIFYHILPTFLPQNFLSYPTHLPHTLGIYYFPETTISQQWTFAVRDGCDRNIHLFISNTSICNIYRVFTGNCWKVTIISLKVTKIRHFTPTKHLDCNQLWVTTAENWWVIIQLFIKLYMFLLLYYLYCLMLDTWGKSIRIKELTIKSFLERFQFVLKCPSIRFDASLGSW